MRKWILFLFMTGTFLIGVCHSMADDADLFTLAVQPEALIILDMSGSMNWDTAGNAASSPNRRIDIAREVIYDLLDDDDSGKDSNNDGSYINPNDEKSLNVKIGYMRFRGVGEADEDDGDPFNGKIRIFKKDETIGQPSTEIGAPYSDLWKKVSDPAETATGCTPLGASLVEGGIYFRNYVNPIDQAIACRQKFVVFITDGSDTVACSGDCSENASDMFKRRFVTVLRAKELYTPSPAPNVVPIQVFAIGFGANMPDHLKKTLNWVAKYGGTDNPLEPNSGNAEAFKITQYIPPTGQELCSITDTNADPANYDLSGYAFLAEDASQLRKALKTIIKTIKEKSYSYTAPSVPTVRMGEGDVVYISSLMPGQTPFWRGNLKAYRLGPDGTLPVDADGNPLNESIIWDASEELSRKSHDQRRIYTYVNGALTSFEYDLLTNADLGVTTEAERLDVINHFRGGMDAYDVNQNGDKTELRGWKLGDIFHSNAAIVGEPSRFFIDRCFNLCPDGSEGFYQRNKNRTKVILVGANDGMLHAFNAETGVEEWAFIPNSLLKNLKDNASLHTYYVDSSPKVADVWLHSNSDPSGITKTREEWKTVLISGLRKGGKHYFALDITDTLNPKYLWEFPKATDSATLAKVGQSWSDPAIGRIRIKVGIELHERWVAFIGGGFDPTNVTGRALFVIDIKTGDILVEFSGLPGMDYSMTAPPTAVDTNFDGYIDKVYIGDLSGQMWVFDISSVNITDWTGKGKILFKPKGAPAEKGPLYYQPAVSLDNNRTPWVFFGTGDRENPTDTNSKDNFYAVKDGGIGSYPRDEDNLRDVTTFVDQTFSIPQEPLKGWYIRLARSEKVLAKPAVFNNLLYFTTYTYATADECKRTGEASLYIVDYLSGGGALVLEDYLLGKPSTRSEKIGGGIPSAPVISVKLEEKFPLKDGDKTLWVTSGRTSATVTIGTTDEDVLTKKEPSPSTSKEILYWKEVTP